MADETPEELAAKLAEGIRKARAAKVADSAKTHGIDSDEAWDTLTGDNST